MCLRADRDSFKVDGSALFQASGVFEVQRRTSLPPKGPPVFPDIRKINATKTAKATRTDTPLSVARPPDFLLARHGPPSEKCWRSCPKNVWD